MCLDQSVTYVPDRSRLLSKGRKAPAIPIAPLQARASNAVPSLLSNGSGTINVLAGTSGTVDFILDVNGYFR